MKATVSYCLMISILLLVKFNNVSAQQQHYYFNNEQIDLFTDSSTLILYFEPDSSFKNDTATFWGDTLITKLVTYIGDGDSLMVRITYAEPIDDIAAFLSGFNLSTADFQGISYGYSLSNGSKFWPTMEVNFKLTTEATIEDLNDILNSYNATLNTHYDDIYNFKISSINNIFSLSDELIESEKIVWAEPNFYSDYQLHDDPGYPYQYYLNNTGQYITGPGSPGAVYGTPDIDIDAPEAWTLSMGSPAIKVAVIDDGVDVHEDLNSFFSPLFSRVLQGYTFPNGDGGPDDSGRHGQCCAGIIASTHNNNKEIKGVAPFCTIIPIRIVKDNGDFFDNNQIGYSIYYAFALLGASVLSNSWGSGAPNNVLQTEFQAAMSMGRAGYGCVVVASAGNHPYSATNKSIFYPAKYSGVLSVGAMDLLGVNYGYSAYGPELSISAPSGDWDPIATYGNVRTIDREGHTCNVSWWPSGACGYTGDNFFDYFGGTSAACPQAAGVAALLLARNPFLTQDQVVCRIKECATDMGAFGRDDYYGSGRLNAYFTVAYDNMLIENENIIGLQTLSASNSIIAGSNCTVAGTGNLTLISNGTVTLDPGFETATGATFEAKIDYAGPCGNGPFKIGNYLADNNSALIDNNQLNAAEIVIFPNPSSGIFTLKTSENNFKKVNVIDIQNNLIFTQETFDQISFIDLSSYAKGIYFVKIITNDKTTINKIIIQ